MELSLNIILEQLSKHSIVSYPKGAGSINFRSVRHFSDNHDKLRPDTLYITSKSDVINASKDYPSIHFVFVHNSFESDTPVEFDENIILLDSTESTLDILYDLQNLFDDYNEWERRLFHCLSDNMELQDMLDVSEAICSNFINVNDNTFKLVAYTRNIPCDDPVCDYLIKNGYHSPETISFFKKKGRMDTWSQSAEHVYLSDLSINKYPVYNRTVYNNYGFLQFVMSCNVKEPGPAVKDRFSLLTDFMVLLAKNKGVFHSWYDYTIGSFFNLLLDGEIDKSKIVQQAGIAEITTSGIFDLFVVKWRGNEQYQIDRLAMGASSVFPDSMIVMHKSQVLILNSYQDRKNSYFSVNQDSLRRQESLFPLLEKFDAFCGVSSPFNDITEFNVAFDQAGFALQFIEAVSNSKRKNHLRSENAKSRITKYEEICSISHLCEKANRDAFAGSIASRALKSLYSYDVANKKNWFDFLYIYLSNERRPTQSSAKLNIHKNNISYRIAKIEEIIQLDLNDAEVRLNLLLAYKYFEAFGGLEE